MGKKSFRMLLLIPAMVLLLVLTGCQAPTGDGSATRNQTEMPAREAFLTETVAPAAPAAAAGQTEKLFYLDANGGTAPDGAAPQSCVLDPNQLRTNTPLGQHLYVRPGFVPLCWNTAADGSGENIPFGSRTDLPAGATLYMRWIPETPETEFTWELKDGAACVTGYTGQGTVLAIPRQLDGHPVGEIASGAFRNAGVETVVLPPSVSVVRADAFSGSTVQTLWLYDSLSEISDAAFSGCDQLRTLFLSADTPPRYSANYMAAFADKVDWLRLNSGKRKLILAGGSASRYAYNSVRLERELDGLVPVNMGVYAYSNMLPQYRIIQCFTEPGDVLVSAPELDTADTQFCVSSALDFMFWSMAEADYANAALLDLRQYSGVFDSLSSWLTIRKNMPPLTWLDTPRRYDDDGNEVLYDTYNVYGDYTLIRPGAAEDVMLAYFRADYTPEAFPESMVEALNRVYREFEARGAAVYFAYTPRNRSSLTEESTPAARRELHAYLGSKLCAPILMDIEDCLYPGTMFYLIDSHLSSDGVYLHTRLLISALNSWLHPQEN